MGWLLWVVLATVSAAALVSRLSWTESARRVGLDKAVALAVAPFLLGLSAALVLWLLPGATHATHLVALAALLAPAFVWQVRRGMPNGVGSWPVLGRLDWVVLTLVVAFVGTLVVDSATVPLIQNDALEYALAARNLFEARDLAAYPSMQPLATRSGFFGPWTHPPTYVALAYLGMAMHGDTPDGVALRWIAPWCLVCGTALVFTLGRLHSARAGAIAALLFVSTPLLYLGAASALIDPLPVLGFSLGLAGLLGLGGVALHAGMGMGVLLGLGLWSHSQAVLFPLLMLPLFALSTWRSRDARTAAIALGVAIVAMLAIGSPPFVRNVGIFGSPISDNPAVFALPSLQWPYYFRLQRGVATWQEVVQYGVFKGFFAPEAYSFSFWFALAGLGTGSAWVRRLAPSRGWGAAAPDPPGAVVAGVALALCLMYFSAAALSASIGIDLMIRNERYLLVLIPCAALLAAVGLDRAGRPLVLGMLTTVVVVLGAAQLGALLAYRQSQIGAVPEGQARLRGWGPHAVLHHLATATPDDAVALSMKPADMFYADRRMVSYLDPRMLDFYAARDEAAAMAVLHRLGVTHVHLPDYFLPPLYESPLMAIAATPRWTELLVDEGGYQLLALRPGAMETAPLTIEPQTREWTRQVQLVLGGRKALKRVALAEAPYALGEESRNSGFGGFFGRDRATSLRSGRHDLRGAMRACSPTTVPTLHVGLDFSGTAYVQLVAMLESARAPARRLLGDRPTRLDGQPTRIERRFRVASDTEMLRLAVEHAGDSTLVVHGVRVQVWCEAIASTQGR